MEEKRLIRKQIFAARKQCSDAQVEERLSQLISTFFYDEKQPMYIPVGDDIA